MNKAAFLCKDFSENHASEQDAQLKNILNETYKLQSHGASWHEYLKLQRILQNNSFYQNFIP